MIIDYVLKYIGYFAAFCTTIAFFPQAIKAWKTKSTKDISLYMFLLLVVGVLSWVVYGILISSLPLVIANLTVLFLAISILIAKLNEGHGDNILDYISDYLFEELIEE